MGLLLDTLAEVERHVRVRLRPMQVCVLVEWFESTYTLVIRVKGVGGSVPHVPATNVAASLGRMLPAQMGVIVDYDPFTIPYWEPRFMGWTVGRSAS